MMSDRILAGYLTEEQLATELRKSLRTVQRWRRLRTGPPVTYNGAQPIYRIDGVKSWLTEREVRLRRNRRRDEQQARGAA